MLTMLWYAVQSVVASPTDAAFSLAGLSGLPTIAPVLGILGLERYTINSLFIAPLVADSMTITFTPFNGALMLNRSGSRTLRVSARYWRSCADVTRPCAHTSSSAATELHAAR